MNGFAAQISLQFVCHLFRGVKPCAWFSFEALETDGFQVVAGRRRHRDEAGSMTASLAGQTAREATLTHANLGTVPGAPPPQLSSKAKKDGTAAAVQQAARRGVLAGLTTRS